MTFAPRRDTAQRWPAISLRNFCSNSARTESRNECPANALEQSVFATSSGRNSAMLRIDGLGGEDGGEKTDHRRNRAACCLRSCLRGFVGGRLARSLSQPSAHWRNKSAAGNFAALCCVVPRRTTQRRFRKSR